MTGAHSAPLVAAVKSHQGSPMIHVNGKPISPLTFFGWAGGNSPTIIKLGTEWQEYALSFTAPEDNDGSAGIHIRIGGDGPGTVWIDDVRFYPGEKTDAPAENFVRQGDWEGTQAEIAAQWNLFQAQYAGVQADWRPDTTTKVHGRQSMRVDIRSAGSDHMHLHFHQTGYRLKKGQRYTYTLWMKADRPRTADFMALHIGEPWTIYSGERAVFSNQVRLARAAGVHLVSFGISMPWPRPGEQPDFSGTDRAIELALAADPEALLLPRFDMAPPSWWLAQHPDDRMLYDDGSTTAWSMASEAWRTEMQERLRALVRHCEAKYGDHMLGYHPCGQNTGEWFYDRSWEQRLNDFSPAMSKGFGRWALAKYGSLDALRQAWREDIPDAAQIRVPSKAEQLHTALGFFRDPRVERKVIDYFEYKQLAMEEPLEMMAKVIKQETAGKKLVCFFYGYLFDMHGLPFGPQGSGHLAMERLLRCPDVDILCSPISYLDREQGGAGCFMSAVDSVRGSGKLWLNEDDTRTYLSAPDSGYGRVETPRGSQWVHQRNFAQLWPRRLACWYMDLPNDGWLNGADLWENIGSLQRFYQGHLETPARWAPEAALIVDEGSAAYTACTSALHSPLVYRMRSQFYRIGAPFGIYLLSDLKAGRVPPAKVYFFANCFHLDPATRAAIRRVTRGKTAVWFYGGGFLGEDAADRNLTDAVGLRLTRIAAQPGIVQAQAGAKLAAGIPETFGLQTSLDPAWAVTEPGATVLARYADGSAAAAAKQTADGLRVYLGVLHCPAALLRNIARAAGVHCYCDSDDVVCTDGAFLGLTATSAGAKRLNFPGPRSVYSALDGREIARRVRHLDLTLEKGETRLFVLR